MGSALAPDLHGKVAPRLLPVLVTGSRIGIGTALLRGLERATCGTASLDTTRERIAAALAAGASDEDALELLSEAHRLISEGSEASGLLLIVDEVGKFLEAAALDPQRHDIYILQRLAERAARSGHKPFVVVALLHQGFQAYAEGLARSAQQEWEKVAGRFEELLFDTPLEQTVELVAGALGIDEVQLPPAIVEEARTAMARACDLGWFGAAKRDRMVACAPRLYPLHPTVLPVLVRILARFGQNERSLFGFLLSSESFGLQEFSEREIEPGLFFRLSDLFDHVRASFGHRLVNRGLRSHWARISGTVEAFAADEHGQAEVLKTVALLNLLDDERLLPRPDALALALDREDGEWRAADTAEALRGRRALHLRGISGGYRLWPQTAVDLDRAFEEATRALGPINRVSELLGEHLDERPIVARRHYIETGNLRHFAVRYVSSNSLTQSLDGSSADGLILVALSDTEAEQAETLRAAVAPGLSSRREILVAIPRPLSHLRDVVEEAQRWQWVAANTPELANDAYSAEEVSRHLRAARRTLAERVRLFVGLDRSGHDEGVQWYRAGSRVLNDPGDRLSVYLSTVCGEIFPKAPRVKNELVNRATLSSAAAGARMRVIEGILERTELPLLGFDPNKAPPEKAIYLSLLRAGRLHRQVGDRFSVAVPEADDDPCNLRPAFDEIYTVLAGAPDQRLSAADVFDSLRRTPFGVRDGLIPILLAVFARAHETRLAFYEDDVFIPRITGFDFLRLIKAPETFDLQFCAIEGVRAEVFAGIVHLLELGAPDQELPQLLEVVTSLATFAGRLPDYSKQTRRISPEAQRVRAVLLAAMDPPGLLFRELPAACGVAPFSTDAEADDAAVARFVTALKGTLDELRSAYPELRRRVARHLSESLAAPPELPELRAVLTERAEAVVGAAADTALRAFCFRLADSILAPEEWLDAVASIVAGKPPVRWKDFEADLFPAQLQPLCDRFLRAASLAMARGGMVAGSRGLCVAVTDENGHERTMPVFVSPEQRDPLDRAMLRIRRTLEGDPQLQVAALSRLLCEIIDAVQDAAQADADVA
jgi:hypothetical protein